MPSVGKITHDHTYATLSSNKIPDVTTQLADVRVEPAEVMNVTGEPDANVDAMHLCHHAGQQKDVNMECSLVVFLVEPAWIEREKERDKESIITAGVTSSKGKAHNRFEVRKNPEPKAISVSLLKEYIYPRLLDPPLALIAWSRQQESVAIHKYIPHMVIEHNSMVSVQKSGFVVHRTNGRVGASLNGKGTDPPRRSLMA